MPIIVDHKARRFEISAIAAALIAKGGLEAATIRKIAQSSGYSKGVVEHYFENMEELISGALDSANFHYQQRAKKATAKLSGIAALRKHIEVTLPLNNAIRDEWKVRLVFLSMAAIHQDIRPKQEERYQRSVEHFERDIKEAMRAGDIRYQDESAMLAQQVLNMTTAISIAALHSPSLYSKATLLGEIDRLIEHLTHS